MPISWCLCDRCVTDLWALFLGFATLKTELVPELHIIEVTYEGMVVFATPLEGVPPLDGSSYFSLWSQLKYVTLEFVKILEYILGCLFRCGHFLHFSKKNSTCIWNCWLVKLAISNEPCIGKRC